MNPDSILTGQWSRAKLLLIGGSAGSFQPILQLVNIFPANLDKTIVLVVHRKKNYRSEIERIFSQNSKLRVREISDKDKFELNTVYIAPANYHTLLENDGTFSLDVSEPVWFSRPSIDVTFESAADSFGSECCAVLLSGANPDGAAAMRKLKAAGALTIVQDPADAEIPEMPAAAIRLDEFHLVLKASEITGLFKKLTSAPGV